jgi:hypothetical protein
MDFYEQIKQMYFKLDNVIHGDTDTSIDVSFIFSDLVDLFSYPSLSTKEAEIIGDLLTLATTGDFIDLYNYMAQVLDAYDDQDPWGYADTEDSIQDGWGENYDMV